MLVSTAGGGQSCGWVGLDAIYKKVVLFVSFVYAMKRIFLFFYCKVIRIILIGQVCLTLTVNTYIHTYTTLHTEMLIFLASKDKVHKKYTRADQILGTYQFLNTWRIAVN